MLAFLSAGPVEVVEGEGEATRPFGTSLIVTSAMATAATATAAAIGASLGPPPAIRPAAAGAARTAGAAQAEAARVVTAELHLIGGGREIPGDGRQLKRRRVAHGVADGPHRRQGPVFGGDHEASLSFRPSAATAREVADLTVPRLTPMARAVSSSDRSR